MSLIDEVRQATRDMTAEQLLRHLLIEAFPGRCVVTSSLRARSIVVLGMIAEIDRATPVVFCHAPGVYPESVEYRALVVDRLGLADVRDPGPDESTPLAGDRDHSEETRSLMSGGASVRTLVHLNRSLAEFACWISAVYHHPYTTDPAPRMVANGRLIRVDPLDGWNQEAVHGWMAAYDLPHHPRIVPPRPTPPPGVVPSYHY